MIRSFLGSIFNKIRNSNPNDSEQDDNKNEIMGDKSVLHSDVENTFSVINKYPLYLKVLMECLPQMETVIIETILLYISLTDLCIKKYALLNIQRNMIKLK